MFEALDHPFSLYSDKCHLSTIGLSRRDTFRWTFGPLFILFASPFEFAQAPLRDRRNETQFRYTGAPASGAPIEGMRQTVSLAALRAGYYMMELRVEAGGDAAAVTKRFEIVR
jgi:hypothetical protein